MEDLGVDGMIVFKRRLYEQDQGHLYGSLYEYLAGCYEMVESRGVHKIQKSASEKDDSPLDFSMDCQC